MQCLVDLAVQFWDLSKAHRMESQAHWYLQNGGIIDSFIGSMLVALGLLLKEKAFISTIFAIINTKEWKYRRECIMLSVAYMCAFTEFNEPHSKTHLALCHSMQAYRDSHGNLSVHTSLALKMSGKFCVVVEWITSSALDNWETVSSSLHNSTWDPGDTGPLRS